MDERDKNPQPRQRLQSVRSGLLGLAAAVLLLVLSRAQGASGASEGASAPPVCSAWHRGQGESHLIDLGRMKRSYEELKDRLSRSITTSMKQEMDAATLKGYDAGLPACRRSEKRSFRPAGRPDGQIPPELVGKKLWFARIEGKNLSALPALIIDDPGAIVFATRVEKLEALSEASRILGRPVSLAPRELPEALGVRCGPAVVIISPKGEVEIHENP